MLRRWRLAALGALVIAVLLAATQSYAAEDVTCDVNGDGFDDLAVGSPGAIHRDRRAAGEVAVFLGSTTGLSAIPAAVLHPGSSGVPSRPKTDAAFGAALACGDIDGDGRAELVVAAPGERVARRPGAGTVYVIHDAHSAIPTAARLTARRTGVPGEPASHAAFGFSLAVGDLIGDGRLDVAIGVPGENRVVVLAGSEDGVDTADAVHFARPDLEELGAALAVGDVDGDGTTDLVAGAPGTTVLARPAAGALALWRGGDPSRGDPEIISHATEGVAGKPRARGRLGQAVALADYDGDGYADIVAGAPGYRLGGAARAGDVLLAYGAAAGAGGRSERINLDKLGIGAAPHDGFGWALALADLDGDGAQELVVGAPRRRGAVTQEGLVTVVSPRAEPQHATLASLGQPVQSGHGLGGTMAAGDFDGNGRADLALGLQGAGTGQLRAGAVALVYGRRTLHLDPPRRRPGTLAGAATGARFGVVGAGQAPEDLPLMSIPLLARDDWGARDPIPSRLRRHAIDRLTIHHAGDRRSGTGPAVYRGWQNWHMDGLRWGDVAYHIIIGADGRVLSARPKIYRGDTATDYDPTGHLLVVLEGNFDVQRPTAAQLEMLPKVVAWATTRYGLSLDEVLGHRDHAATSCPGENLNPYIASGRLAADVAELIELGRVVMDG